jgi:hypothetical protein
VWTLDDDDSDEDDDGGGAAGGAAGQKDAGSASVPAALVRRSQRLRAVGACLHQDQCACDKTKRARHLHGKPPHHRVVTDNGLRIQDRPLSASLWPC